MKINQYTWDPEKDLIAEGAFAEVFKALDTNTQGRVVALKIYKEAVAKGTQGSSNQKKYSLEAEFRKIDGLSHTNIITYYGQSYIEHKDAMGRSSSYPLIIMEYAVHGTLTDFLKTKPSAEVIDKLIKEIIHGVAYLHSEGILHRDLKPGNILITSNRKGEPVAKITDFGISRDLLDEAETLERSMTAGVGTPHYMAPEQFFKTTFGLNGEISERTDIWAIGVIVYKAIIGLLPFGTKGGDYEQVRTAIIGQNPKLKGLKSYESLVMSSLMKKAEQRPATALDLLPMIGEQANEAMQKDWEAQAAKAEVNPVVLGEAADDKTIAPETQIAEGQTVVNPKPVAPKPEPSRSKTPAILAGIIVLVAIVIAVVVFTKPEERPEDPNEAAKRFSDMVKNTGSDVGDSTIVEPVQQPTETAQNIPSQKPATKPTEDQAALDKQAWKTAESTATIDGYKKYLKDFADGEYAYEARMQLNKLRQMALNRANREAENPKEPDEEVNTFGEINNLLAQSIFNELKKTNKDDTKLSLDQLMKPNTINGFGTSDNQRLNAGLSNGSINKSVFASNIFRDIEENSKNVDLNTEPEVLKRGITELLETGSATIKPKMYIITPTYKAPAKPAEAPKEDYSKRILSPIKSSDGLYGYRDRSGQLLIPYQYEKAEPFSEGLAAVEKGNKWGFINKGGETLVPNIYDKVGAFSEERAMVQKDGKAGFVDSTGKLVIPLQYDVGSLMLDYEFSEGLASVKKNKRLSYIDKSGKEVIFLGYRYSSGLPFSEGRAMVGTGGKYGFIDKQGKEVAYAEYDLAGSFRQGFARVLVGKKWGFINSNGRLVIKPEYTDVTVFSDGMAAVKKRKKWGYINTAGELKVPYKYDRTGVFTEGRGPVDKDGLWGYVDKQGNLVINHKYKRYGYFKNGQALVDLNGKLITINKDGNVIN